MTKLTHHATAIALVLALTPATAGLACSTRSTLVVSERPPAPRIEVRPADPGPDHVWVAGTWTWTDRDYIWIAGKWVKRPHPRSVWLPGYWKHQGRSWIWIPGGWKR